MLNLIFCVLITSKYSNLEWTDSSTTISLILSAMLNSYEFLVVYECILPNID